MSYFHEKMASEAFEAIISRTQLTPIFKNDTLKPIAQ